MGFDLGFVPVPAFPLGFFQTIGWHLAMEGDHRRVSGRGPSDSEDGDQTWARMVQGPSR